MTRQEFFNTTVNHILTQKVPAVIYSPYGSKLSCVYFDCATGNRCAIGVHFAPDTPEKILSAQLSIEELVEDYPSAWKYLPLPKTTQNLRFMDEIQRSHDDASASGENFLPKFLSGMRSVAIRWNLDDSICK